MCGIVGYVGNKDAYPILIKGLHRLEYRGYDSAGMALLHDEDINIFKCQGKVSELETYCQDKNILGQIGIAHTRWATHGEPNDINAHPHCSSDGKIAMIHNGIIENYQLLKTELQKRGHIFTSDTDSEVLIQLIENIKSVENVELSEAVRLALTQIACFDANWWYLRNYSYFFGRPLYVDSRPKR